VLRSFGLQVFPLETARDYRPDRLQRRRILLIDDSTDLRTLSPGAHDVVGVRYTVAVAQTATEADVAQYKRLQTDADDDQELRPGDIKPFNLFADRATASGGSGCCAWMWTISAICSGGGWSVRRDSPR
jgi:hypothetical protein